MKGTTQIRFRRHVKGQSLSVVGLLLGLGVLIGLVAIAVDGGSALLQRRVMQNSADAASLAGIQLMSQRVLISGSGGVGHPSYALTQTVLLNAINSMAANNRGGAIGATSADYDVQVYYHYTEDSPQFPGTFNPSPVVSNTTFVPDYVDGIKVISMIRNPTVFAKALPLPIPEIQVRAVSAMALSATCRQEPPGGPGNTLPFTRFRYSFEQELPTKGNDLCNPFLFWDSNNDVGGPQGDNNFKNKLSFNTRSFYASPNPSGEDPGTPTQLLSGYDFRNNGSGSPPVPSGVDMRGSVQTSGTLATTDQANWLNYQWQGWIMTDTNRIGNPTILGDWAENYNGDQGNNIQNALLYQIQNAPDGGYTSISGPPLNWGRAITRTIYLWGDGILPSSSSAQEANPRWQCNQGNCSNRCSQNPIPGDCWWDPGWTNLDIRIQGNHIRANGEIDRVRFTDAVQMVFYENVNGGPLQAQCPLPGGGFSNISTSSSGALGILPSAVMPGPDPNGDTCGNWLPGSGVYYRQISP